MRFYARFGIGLASGALAAALAFWLADAAWPVAVAGGLVGALGFLATFFLWDADRPPSEAEPQGYEQVLFDRRNSLHAALLLLVFVGAAFGPGALVADSPAPVPEPSSAELDRAEADLLDLSGMFDAAHAAFAQGGDAGDLRALADIANALRLEVQRFEAPEAAAPRQADLMEAASLLALAFEELQTCVDEQAGACMDARLAHADAQRLLMPDAA